MPIEMVKIFGERNSGTNALAQVIANNSKSRLLPSTEFDIDAEASRRAWAQTDPCQREQLLDRIYDAVPNPHMWKHTATNFSDTAGFGSTLVLFCVKHPASWLTSLFRNPYCIPTERPSNIADFLEYEWETPARERLSRGVFRPLELYNAKIRAHLDFARHLGSEGIASMFVRQEDLLLNQKEVFRSLATHLAEPRSRFRARRRSTKKGWMPVFFVRRYYQRERWRESLRGLESKVNAQVDWSTLKQFAYEPL
jgi:hypothetical protein